MFAVLESGSKQYHVKLGDIIKVEKLIGDVGSKIKLDKVLATDKSIGAPLIIGANVVAEIIDQRKAEKDIIFKKKRRHNYRRKKGHRQNITVLKIEEINA